MSQLRLERLLVGARQRYQTLQQMGGKLLEPLLLLFCDVSIYSEKNSAKDALGDSFYRSYRQRLLQSLYPKEFGELRTLSFIERIVYSFNRGRFAARESLHMAQLSAVLDSLARQFKFPDIAIQILNTNPLNAPGGLERYVLESVQYAREELGLSSLLLYPEKGGEAHRVVMRTELGQEIAFPAAALVEALFVLFSSGALQLHSLHIQHLMGWHQDDVRALIQLAREFSATTSLYIHDYFGVCTQHNLLKNGLAYCGAPPDIHNGPCGDCRSRTGLPEHRAFMRQVLANVDRCIAPSETAAAVFQGAYPNLGREISIVPHRVVTPTESLSVNSSEKLCIVFLGACGYNKGIHHFSKLLEACGEKYRWATVGIEDHFCNHPLVRHFHYSFHENQDLGAILRSIKPAISFLCSVWPETFSYTLHESMMAGLPIVSIRGSGNIENQIDKLQLGRVFADIHELIQVFQSTTEVETKLLLSQAKSFKVNLNEDGLREIYSDQKKCL